MASAGLLTQGCEGGNGAQIISKIGASGDGEHGRKITTVRVLRL